MSAGTVKAGAAAALARKAGLISSLTLVSRLLGLLREQVFAALLGAGLYADAFQIAFRIPNLLRDLFAEGALSAAFVPTYTRVLKQEGRAAAARLANRVLTAVGLLLGVAVVVGWAAAPLIVAALAPGYDAVPGKSQATALLTRVMLPFLPLVSFAAIAMGMLNAEQRYGAPALAPAMFNVVAIVWGLGLWALGFGPWAVALGWSVGTLLGGVAQVLAQAPELRRLGFRLAPEWAPRDPGLRAIAGLMAPATLGLAAVQVNLFLSSLFASHEPGAVSWLNYAFRILYLPIGIFGVAVGTIATTGLSRHAAEGDLEALGETLRGALRLVTFLTVPATLGLVVLGEPIVRLLYERGRFGTADTRATATALACYAAGLVAYTSVKVLAPVFYVLGRPRVPLLASLLAVAANLLVIASLHDRLGFRAVALGTSAGALANATLLLATLQRRLRALRGHGLRAALLRMLLAALGMGAAVALVARTLAATLGSTGVVAQALGALVPVALGIVVYAWLARSMRLGEAEALLALLRRRSRRVE